MSLRRPPAHLRGVPSWRRSGGESSWESLTSVGEYVPRASHPPSRTRRPQSAVEGGQLDSWLEHLQRMQRDPLREPIHDHVPVFNARTTSMATLNRENPGSTWRPQGTPTYSRASSSCGSPSFYESSLGSQESLRTPSVFSSSERRGSCERAHIRQAPRKEQAHLSYLAPVRIGWLPIQRRVMMVGDACQSQNQLSDQSAGQFRLKQPITPIFKNRASPKSPDEEVERAHTSLSSVVGATSRTPDPDSHFRKQVPEKQRSPAHEVSRSLGLQALRRGWNNVRASAFPGSSRSIELPAESCSDPTKRSPPMKTTCVQTLKYMPIHGTTSCEQYRPQVPPQGTNHNNTAERYRSLHRANSFQSIKSTGPELRANSCSHVHTSSAATTLTPQNKAGFSSITISSRKVSRSASLPSSGFSSPSPPPHVDPLTMQRRPTIVKVTEQRMTSGPPPRPESAPRESLDGAARPRKATIVKVTEHRERYSSPKPGPDGSQLRHRHSYVEGTYKGNNTWSPGNHSQTIAGPNLLNKPNSPPATNPATLERNDGSLHRSTLSLFVSSTPTAGSPTPSEVSLRSVGPRTGRPQRPQSCYGNVSARSEPNGETATRTPARKWSCGLPLEAGNSLVNPDGGFGGWGTAARQRGQRAAWAPEPNRGEEEERAVAQPQARRASSGLTLIQAPGPHSQQSAEEVLALNAAAVIANIKLQRQRSKKHTPNGNPAKDAESSVQRNTGTETREKTHPEPNPVQHHRQPDVPPSVQPATSSNRVSLQEALQRSRPDFIRRSQERLQELERRAQERRQGAESGPDPHSGAVRPKRAKSAWAPSVRDNAVKPRDRVVVGRETQHGSKRRFAEVKKKKEEGKNRDVCLTNRQRMELFKKKLLDQILQRNNS